MTLSQVMTRLDAVKVQQTAAARPRTFQTVETSKPLKVGDKDLPRGAVGTIIAKTDDEFEIAFYSPRDIVAFTDAA